MRFPSCSEALDALAKGLDEKTCHDFKAIRQVVMCDAWHEKGFAPETFHERIEESWKKARGACAAHGGITPEVGFLTSEERITNYLPPGALAAKITRIKEVRKNGLHAGVIVEEDNGASTVCINTNCGTLVRGAGTLENATTVLEAAGYEVV